MAVGERPRFSHLAARHVYVVSFQGDRVIHRMAPHFWFWCSSLCPLCAVARGERESQRPDIQAVLIQAHNKVSLPTTNYIQGPSHQFVSCCALIHIHCPQGSPETVVHTSAHQVRHLAHHVALGLRHPAPASVFINTAAPACIVCDAVQTMNLHLSSTSMPTFELSVPPSICSVTAYFLCTTQK